jgi:hypothetical protein
LNYQPRSEAKQDFFNLLDRLLHQPFTSFEELGVLRQQEGLVGLA